MREPTRDYCGTLPHRTTTNSVWPLRGPDGLTYAERKALTSTKEATDATPNL